jgi:copper chaperone CopZ
MAEKETKLIFSVPTMHCSHCESKIKVILESVDGIQGVRPDLSTGTVAVELDPSAPADEQTIRAELKAGGYPAA